MNIIPSGPAHVTRLACKAAAVLWLAGMMPAAGGDAAAPDAGIRPEQPQLESGADAYRDMRRAAAARPRRIIYNNDGNDALKPFKSTEEFLARRSSGLESTHVDTIFYCTGVHGRYLHRTELGEPFTEWITSLHQSGADPLDLMATFARQHGREIFWSLRLNDIHDSIGPYMHLISKWKLDHPDLLMAPSWTVFPYGRAWTALDFSKQGVRDYLLALIGETLRNHDLDGIELDFTRHDIFFRNTMFGLPATVENLETMTAFMQNIRKLADETGRQRGRPLLISIRTADSVEYLMETGIDLVRWFEEDLVDLWTPGGFFQLQPWQESIALAHRHGVKVYPSLCQTRLPQKNPDAWRAEAMDAWKTGADGIHVFNFWELKLDQHPLLRELGDPAILEGLPRQASHQADLHIPVSATRRFTVAENITAALSFVRDTPGRFLAPEILWRKYPFLTEAEKHAVPADFPSLADAVRAAKPGDEIWVRSDHQETIGNLLLDNKLRIISCDETYLTRRKGARLSITGTGGMTMKNASVVLDGIEIGLAAKALEPALVMEGASVVLRNCTIRGQQGPGRQEGLIGVTAWNETDRILFDQVTFDLSTRGGTLVRLDPDSGPARKCHIAFRNCLILGGDKEAVLIHPGRAGFWDFDHCTILHSSPSPLAEGKAGSRLVFRNCILKAPAALNAANGFIEARHNLIDAATPFKGHVEMASSNILGASLLGDDHHPAAGSPAMHRALRFPVDPEAAAPVLRDLHGCIRGTRPHLGCLETPIAETTIGTQR